MNTNTKINATEREEIEALLPWHAAGTLSRREALKVEHALAGDAELAAQFATIREDLSETIVANESLGAPSARAMQKLMADIEADASTASRARSSFSFGEWLSDKLAAFSPRTLAWSAGAAALAVVLQAGLLAGMFVNERQGAGSNFVTASVPTVETVKGPQVMVGFAPEANIGDVTKLLETYKMAVTEGPAPGGIYTVNVRDDRHAEGRARPTVKKLQDEKSVRFVLPKAE